MFNKARFNHTLFSRVLTSGLSGGDARAITTSTGTLRVIRRLSGIANAITQQESTVVRLRYFLNSSSNAVSNAPPKIVVRRRYFDGQADALTTSWGGRVVSVAIFILTMPDLVMQEGDVLQIDTGEYTVTLNGENAVWMVTDLSEFFRLEPGEGTISIEFEDEGEADIRILWKERYL